MSTANQTALDYLTNIAEQRFWGIVTLKFENGLVVHLRQEENLKPSELSGKPRRSYGNTQN
jgi:hypothetical protein